MGLERTSNDYADFWRYDIGVNVFPAVSKTKKPLTTWKEYQTKPIPQELHEEWKSQNKFDQGMAIICGETFHKIEKRQLNGIDCDNKLAIDEFRKDKTLAEIAKDTLVEQHANKDKCHILFYTDKPIQSQASLTGENIPKLEVKSEGNKILYCAGSFHKDGSLIDILDNKIPAVVEKEQIENKLEEIFKKYNLSYLSKQLTINPEPLHKVEGKLYEGNNRGEKILSYLASIQRKNPEFSDEMLFLSAKEYQNKNCVDKYDDDYLRVLVKQSQNWIEEKIAEEKTEEKPKEKKTKEDSDYKVSEIATLIGSKFHFRSTTDIDELFMYEEGSYTNDGSENFVKTKCEKLFKEPSTHKCNEVVNAIKRRNPIKREDLAGDPEIYNFTNGLFSIQAQKLSEHTPDYVSRNQFNFEYDESAKCPNFEKFLESSLPEEIKRENVLEDMASCFLSQLNFKKIILYVGEGYNGKSVLTNTLTKMLGENNVSHVSLKQFNRAFSMANLEGKFANIHSDIDKGSIGSLADLKVASTEDPLFIERKGKDGYTVQENPKLLFACNQPPELDEDTVAIFGRLRITEWEEEFLPNDPKTDPEITEKISGELSGIFNKLVPFIIKLKENKKFTNNESIEEIEESYLLKAQSSLFYAKNNLEIDFTSKTPRTEIYDDYKRLCFENKVRKESPTAFNKMIEKELGVHWKKERVGNNTIPCWNIKIKTDSVGFQEMLK